MVGHGGSSAGSYLADPTSPIPSHCASIVATSTLRAKIDLFLQASCKKKLYLPLLKSAFFKGVGGGGGGGEGALMLKWN